MLKDCSWEQVFEFLMTRFSLVTERSFSLSTYNDQSVIFAVVAGGYEISVEDMGEKQNKGKIFPFVYNNIMMTRK